MPNRNQELIADFAEEHPPESSDESGDPRLITDALLAAVILFVLPFAVGVLGLGPLALAAYSLAAGMLLTTIAWRRERKTARSAPGEIIAAVMVRTLVVGLIGGLAFIVGSLLG